jgi:glycosyltransferase involved in cell wall biosynthesis
MKIIIDARPLLYNTVSEEAAVFIVSALTILSAEYTQHDWFFLVDQSYVKQKKNLFPQEKLIEKKSMKGQLGWRFWYGWQITNLIKKYKADLLITTGGVGSSSSIRQCVWMPQINETNKNYFSFYKKRLQKTVQKAQALFVFSERNKQQLIGQYKIPDNKLHIVYGAAEDSFMPLSWTEKENIKIKYAGGIEYFLVTGKLQNKDLINVLKAFSQFKKRQQSNMQLVIAMKNINEDIQFTEKLDSYKYKSDVHVFDRLTKDETIKILSAAYALIYPVFESEPATVLLNACKAKVPVITTDDGCAREMAADAVLYADINNYESLAMQLMLLYKDELIRSQLIEKGKIRVQQFSLQQTTTQIWNGIFKAE